MQKISTKSNCKYPQQRTIVKTPDKKLQKKLENDKLEEERKMKEFLQLILSLDGRIIVADLYPLRERTERERES